MQSETPGPNQPTAKLLRTVAALLACLTCIAASPAFADGNGGVPSYGTIVLRARVVDRRGTPVAGLQVRFHASAFGIARADDGTTSSAGFQLRRRARTDRNGLASVDVAGTAFGVRDTGWFRGIVDEDVHPDDPGAEITLVGDQIDHMRFEVPDIDTIPPTLRLTPFEQSDTHLGPFPVWLSDDKTLSRLVVLVEGFDLYNIYSATDNMVLVEPVGDALRAAGVSLLVVNFPDSHMPPDQLAPIVADAIRRAAAASGRRVAVAGLSAGGIAARWALVSAETGGQALPVNMLLTLDTPNRGANLDPALQAMILRYGTGDDRAALKSEAARALLTSCVEDLNRDVTWKTVGLPLASREIPLHVVADEGPHQAFYDRLHRLNDNQGYPKACPVVAIANSNRAGPPTCQGLLHVWLPWTYGWTLHASADDRAPGSLLPPLYVGRFITNVPFGIAGAYLRSAPTFLPATSALDAGLGEQPPFDAFYERPANLPPASHDRPDSGAMQFAVHKILAADWQPLPSKK